MFKVTILILSLFFIFEANAKNLSERENIQKKYDQACEQARTNKITPLKIKYIEECVNKWEKEREYCERFYSTYGNATKHKNGGRPALFYDLPECNKAFEFKKSYRK